MEATPTSDLSNISNISNISLSPRAMEIGQRVCIVKGSLMGLVGILQSIDQETVTIRLEHPRNTVFVRVPAKLVATHHNVG